MGKLNQRPVNSTSERRIVHSCGCALCDMGLDPNHMIENRPAHGVNPIGSVPMLVECTRSRLQ